ncbi:MAG: hypothetical protein O7G31_09225 [Calditrichaeota bacterium]|nr:hypothetical protein [Calditrichota bacterium]
MLTLEAKSARILVDGEEKEIATEELITGDIMLIKPGTITKGASEVTDVVPADSFLKEDVLRLAASAEQNSEHPLAQAVVARGRKEELQLSPAA